jgi:hypothetical protein
VANEREARCRADNIPSHWDSKTRTTGRGCTAAAAGCNMSERQEARREHGRRRAAEAKERGKERDKLGIATA